MDDICYGGENEEGWEFEDGQVSDGGRKAYANAVTYPSNAGVLLHIFVCVGSRLRNSSHDTFRSIRRADPPVPCGSKGLQVSFFKFPHRVVLNPDDPGSTSCVKVMTTTSTVRI